VLIFPIKQNGGTTGKSMRSLDRESFLQKNFYRLRLGQPRPAGFLRALSGFTFALCALLFVLSASFRFRLPPDGGLTKTSFSRTYQLLFLLLFSDETCTSNCCPSGAQNGLPYVPDARFNLRLCWFF
jgi:hypothetical protein